MKLSFQLLLFGIAAFLTGCSVAVNVYNDTPEPVYDVNITWGTKDYWGENRQTFAVIQPGERMKFKIPTNPEGTRKNEGVGVDMSYIWQGEKYEYPDMIIYVGPGDNYTYDFRIAGKTAKSILHSLIGPGSSPIIGIVRKKPEEEYEILETHKALWRTADRIEVKEHWQERIPKNDGSYPDWDWVEKESITVVLFRESPEKADRFAGYPDHSQTYRP